MNTFVSEDLLTVGVFWSWTAETLELRSKSGLTTLIEFSSHVNSGGHGVQIRTAAWDEAMSRDTENFFAKEGKVWPSEGLVREAVLIHLANRTVNVLDQQVLCSAYLDIVRAFIDLLAPYFDDSTPHHYDGDYGEHCIRELHRMKGDWTGRLGVK